MREEGKHIYCVIKCDGEMEFAVEGISERVYAINYMGLAAVVIDLAPKSLKAHRFVVEEVFKDFPVLPMSFGCIAKDAEQAKEMLKSRFYYLRDLLGEMEGKVELGLKAWWKSNPMSADFIDKYYPKVRDWRQRLADAEPSGGERHTKWIEAKVRLKEMSMNAVADIRSREAERIITSLGSLFVNKRIKAIASLKMILNAAFLVNKDDEGEFDNVVNGLARKYGEEIEFISAGPLPPYSFVNLTVKPS